MSNTEIWDALGAPFHVVHWRAQTLNREGTKALALAYIDARDVMERLDSVVGPGGWQDAYSETPRGRLICTLSILSPDGDWIAKSDGAGDTDVEGDKGAISDAFKRAAVKWGIGRYLYSLKSVWAPCETYEGRDGKKKWSKWGSGADRVFSNALAALNSPEGPHVRGQTGSGSVQEPERISKAQWSKIVALLESTNTNAATILTHFKVDDLKKLTAAQAIKAINQLEDKLSAMAKEESNKTLAEELGDDIPY